MITWRTREAQFVSKTLYFSFANINIPIICLLTKHLFYPNLRYLSSKLVFLHHFASNRSENFTNLKEGADDFAHMLQVCLPYRHRSSSQPSAALLIKPSMCLCYIIRIERSRVYFNSDVRADSSTRIYSDLRLAVYVSRKSKLSYANYFGRGTSSIYSQILRFHGDIQLHCWKIDRSIWSWAQSEKPYTSIETWRTFNK